MSLDILLPCIRFAVAIHPGDPNQPTDLEAAALYFIQHSGELGTDFDHLKRFLGLREAVVAEMMIRFLNRGWTKIAPVTGAAPRLYLSPKAEEALACAPGDRGKALASTEEGRRFRLCYDLIGGGVAVIPRQYLTKSAEDSKAVPRRINANGNDGLYGCPLDGYLPNKSAGENSDFGTQILRALQADRNSRQYFRDGLGRQSYHVSILPPGRAPSLDDVEFYRCNFDVIPAPDDDEGDLPPILRCTETRSREARKLGELNSDAIVELAQLAKRDGDERFWKTLKKNAIGDSFFRLAVPDPLQNLRAQVRAAEKAADFEDLAEMWEQVKDRIAIMSASRIDFDDSRVVKAEDLRTEIGVAMDQARRRIVLSSAVIRADSPELSGSGADTLSMLTDLEAGPERQCLIVHGVAPRAVQGRSGSHEAAIARLVTALGSEHVHVVSDEQHHLRTSFLLCDFNRLLLFSGNLFDEHPVGGFLLRTAASRGTGTFEQMVANWPPELRERIELLTGDAAPAAEEQDHGALPAEVASAMTEIEAMLAQTNPADGEDPAAHQQLLYDLDGQMHWLARWIETSSESVEMLVGLEIPDTAWRMVREAAPDEPLFVGVAGRMDSRAVMELREAIAMRLTRQDLIDGERAETIVCLPRLPEFDEIAAKFEEHFSSIADDAKLLRTAPGSQFIRPVGFVMSSSAAMLAYDGLVQFVPTAGRRIKGTNLGLCLRGARARALALAFVQSSWPDCAQALSGTARAARTAGPSSWPVTLRRQNELRALAQSEDWFEDGNCGAHGARKSMRDPGGRGAWSRFQAEAAAFLAGNEEDRRLAFALVKAAAIAEFETDSDETGALARLALRARDQRDLTVVAVLAEHLPAQSVFRDSLVRKLAYCLARRRAPKLDADEKALLSSPSMTVQALACLLMMDGLSGELPGWLAYMEPSADTSALAGFTRALANYVQDGAIRFLDLGHISTEKGEDRLEAAIARVKPRMSFEVNRQFHAKAAEPVRKLHEALFRTKDAFVADLYQLFEHDWANLDERKRRQRLLALVDGSTSDLEVDLFAAAKPSAEPVNPVKLAHDYYSRKHDRMRQQTGLEPVKLHLSGRYAIKSLEIILEIVTHDIAAALLDQATLAEIALAKTAKEFMRGDDEASDVEVGWLLQRVKSRLRRPDANAELTRPPWTVPRVSSMDDPDWQKLETAYLEAEFDRNTSFHDVVKWFLRDPTAGAAGTARLLLLHQLLEDMATEVEPDDLVRGQDALNERVGQIVSNARTQTKRMTDLVEQLSAAPKDSLAAADHTMAFVRQTEEAMRSADIEASLLAAADLVETLGRLETQRRQVVAALRQELCEGCSEPQQAEVRRLVSDRSADLAATKAARRYLQLGQMFRARRLEIDTSLPLDIVDGTKVFERIKPGADGLLLAIAAALPRGVGGMSKWSSNDLASAILGFFSGLANNV
ncbi:MAG: hypothetical protein JWL86_750, partial [Rhizobium sp.]|nr:hypothetical protein [Rhizobium sp.]